MSSFAVALILLLAVSLAGFAAGGGFRRERLLWLAVPLVASLAGAALYALEPAASSPASSPESRLSQLTAPTDEPETPLTPGAHPGVPSGGVREAGDMNDMAARLAARLEKNPDDGPGWALLARAYAWIGRYKEADAAFAKAAKLKLNDPNLQADWDAARAKEAGAGAPSAPEAAAAAPGGAFLAGTVSIAEPLQRTLKKTDTVFVFARAPGGGPPLAVERFKATALPAKFRLDDSDSMVPGRNLSSASKVQLVARLSASGNAIRQPGDIESPALSVKPGTGGLTLEIGAAQ